ncbi:HAMP domain-containing sensor histidine kinase [Treponema porcinum]|uniref:HAMP domain-containing sensor histidine kinase n=1 Tax=Treponema porcinum TaxID=261392 RepID=UPI0023534ACB|nr:HAMP domain-containing sensor histidine kinase [Treponema porcinum]MCI5645769.1 HAMP domain-containing histidine kinase [Treponema porcinum]MDY4467931.1 HAMP domain-containing sensor histidine kinase [Treponema porcinum]
MTVKRQLTLLISLIICLPVFTALIIYGYYCNSSKRLLLSSYRRSPEKADVSLTSDDLNSIKKSILSLSPKVEAALIVKDRIIESTIADFPQPGTTLQEGDLWKIIKQTGEEFYYLTETPLGSDRKHLVLLVSRISKKKNQTNMFYSLLDCVLIFVIICAVATCCISRTITSSLSHLVKQTEKIAKGDLTPQEQRTPAKSRNEFTDLTEHIDSMRAALLDAKRKQQRFIMGITHDLRTPISVIKGYTEALYDGVITSEKETKKSLEIINVKTSQLEEMITSLINYCTFFRDNFRRQITPHCIKKQLEAFAKSAETTGRIFHRKISCNINLLESTDIPVNEQLLARALENLFGNALRYTEDDGEITITADESDECITITFSDTGCGIAEKDISHLFDLFYRGTNSRREQGLGIGLSVVKDIVDLHGWNIAIRSELGKGSDFIIRIPKSTNRTDGEPT